jgi:hypothetical protein
MLQAARRQRSFYDDMASATVVCTNSGVEHSGYSIRRPTPSAPEEVTYHFTLGAVSTSIIVSWIGAASSITCSQRLCRYDNNFLMCVVVRNEILSMSG